MPACSRHATLPRGRSVDSPLGIALASGHRDGRARGAPLVARVAHNGKAPAPAARSARGEAPFADRPVQRVVSPTLGEHDDLPNPPIP